MGCFMSKDNAGAPQKHVGLKEANGCRDVGFLVFFIFFWVGMFVITGFAVDRGDVDRLLHPTDSYGFLCGKLNTFQNVRFDLSDRRNLYYLNSIQLHDPRNWKFAKTICVKECPSFRDRCPLDRLPCTGNNQYRCPYYRMAENGVFDSLNFSIADQQLDVIRNVNPSDPQLRTLFWTNTTYFSLLRDSNQTTCNSTLGNTSGFNMTVYDSFKLSTGKNVKCGPFYQFSSQFNFGPCYPVWESTVEYCHRCYPDRSFFAVARSAVSVTLEGQLIAPFPESAQKNTIKHMNSRFAAKLQQYVADLQRSWWLVIATGLGAAVVFSGIFLLLLVYFPSAMVYVVLAVSVLAAVGFTLWCFQLAGMLVLTERYVGKHADRLLPDSLDPSKLDRQIWFWIGIGFVVFTVIYTVVCAVFAAGLSNCARALQAAALAITDIATLFFFPLFTFVLEAALVIYFVVVTYLIFSAGHRRANYRDPLQFRPLSVRELYKNLCPPIPGYLVFPDKDSPDKGVYSAPQSLDVFAMARSCNGKGDLCAGFTNHGFFKSEIPADMSIWIDVDPNKNVCLYKKTANWTQPPPAAFLAPPPMLPPVERPVDNVDSNGNPIQRQRRTLDDCVLDPNCYISYAWDTALRFSYIYFVFGLIFTHHVLVGLTFLTAAGAVAYWYWRNDNMPVHPTLKSLFKSLCYHLGSICLYAFLYTLLLPIYLPAKLLQRVFCNPTRSTSVKWVTCCCDPFIQFLDRLTLCMIAIKGKSYVEAARKAFCILANAGGNLVAMIDTTIDFLVFTCKVAVALLVGVLTFFLVGLPVFTDKFRNPDTYICNPIFVIFLATGFAYAVADLYFAILEAAVGVVFLSLLEDMQAHGGRPLHAPPGLAELICIVPPKPPCPPSTKTSTSSSSSSSKSSSKKSSVKPPPPSVTSKSSSKSSAKPEPPPKPCPPPSSPSSKSSCSKSSKSSHRFIPPCNALPPATAPCPPAPKPLAPLRPLPAAVMSTVSHTYSPLNVAPPIPPPGYYTSFNAAYPNRYHPPTTLPAPGPGGPVMATIQGNLSGTFQGTLSGYDAVQPRDK